LGIGKGSVRQADYAGNDQDDGEDLDGAHAYLRRLKASASTAVEAAILAVSSRQGPHSERGIGSPGRDATYCSGSAAAAATACAVAWSLRGRPPGGGGGRRILGPRHRRSRLLRPLPPQDQELDDILDRRRDQSCADAMQNR